MKAQAISRATMIALFCLTFVQAQAGDIRLVSGSLDFLRSENTIHIKYVYDGMLVGEMNEADYINHKVTEFNKKEAGKGEKWLAGWTSDRAGHYQPAFERQFTKSLDREMVPFISTANDVKYTMILKTVRTEPGWAGTPFALINFHKDSYIDADATFVETARPDTVLASISVKEATGSGNDYDAAIRIRDAYATCGSMLGKFLRHAVAHPLISSGGARDYSGEFSGSDPGEIVRRLKSIRSPEYAAETPAVLPLLKHEDAHVVRDACRTLAVIANKDVIPSIEPLLQDRRSAVRKDAQDAIDKLRAKP